MCSAHTYEMELEWISLHTMAQQSTLIGEYLSEYDTIFAVKSVQILLNYS